MQNLHAKLSTYLCEDEYVNWEWSTCSHEDVNKFMSWWQHTDMKLKLSTYTHSFISLCQHLKLSTFAFESELTDIGMSTWCQYKLSCQLILNKEEYWICQGHSVRCRWWGETKTMWSISIVLVKLRPVLVYLLFSLNHKCVKEVMSNFKLCKALPWIY